MDHGQLSIVADKGQWVCTDTLLNTCGKAVQLWQCQRSLTPFHLSVALTTPCARPRVATWADVYHSLHALCTPTVTSKAIYNQWVEPHVAAFMSTMASHLRGTRMALGQGETSPRRLRLLILWHCRTPAVSSLVTGLPATGSVGSKHSAGKGHYWVKHRHPTRIDMPSTHPFCPHRGAEGGGHVHHSAEEFASL
jgi:hypothetical protein